MELRNLTVEEYKKLIDRYGMEKVWNVICEELKNNDWKEFSEKFFSFDELGKLYEVGLAHTNKISKKEMGKYYTPKDVCCLMSQMLFETDNNTTLADTGCGAGNLILEALDFTNAVKTVYLFDLDKLALDICEARIVSKFGNRFNIIKKHGNFLSEDTILPSGVKVIANPPYTHSTPSDTLPSTSHQAYYQSKDLYVGFMEKILKSTSEAVLITPQSFLVGSKFSIIREQLSSSFEGEIYTFDNIPASIFNGKKEGIFNTNTSNSVRAAITHIIRKENPAGFRLSHLIRFKEEERGRVVSLEYLRNQLGDTRQNLKQPLKCFKELESFVNGIMNSSTETIKSLISSEPTEYKIRVNNSARYFIVGTVRELERDGYYDVYAKDEKSFYLLYALLNSSYCYMFWRMFDGGILYPKSVLLKTPMPNINLTKEVMELITEMVNSEEEYLVYKKNASKMQESVKFSESLRERLNEGLFGGGIPFYLVHQNSETLTEKQDLQ